MSDTQACSCKESHFAVDLASSRAGNWGTAWVLLIIVLDLVSVRMLDVSAVIFYSSQWGCMCCSPNLCSPWIPTFCTAACYSSTAAYRNNLWAVFWSICGFVYSPSSLNMSTFSSFLQERLRFPRDFSDLHVFLSNLNRFLNPPNPSSSKQSLDLRFAFFVAFQHKLLIKSWKIKPDKR